MSPKFCEMMRKLMKTAKFELRAVQKRDKLIELENCWKIILQLRKSARYSRE